MVYKDLLQHGLSWLKRGGVHPATMYRSAYSRVLLTLNIPEAMWLLVLCVYQLYARYSGIMDLMMFLETFFVVEAYVILLFIQSYHQEKLNTFLNDVDRFWPLSINGKVQELEMEKKIHKMGLFIKIVKGFLAVNASMFILTPLVINSDNLPYFGWLPDNPGNLIFYLTYLCQFHVHICFTFVIYGFNMTFWTMIIILGIQYDLLKEFFVQIGKGDPELYVPKIKEFVNQHNFVLEMTNKVASVHALFLANQVLCCTVFTSTTLCAIVLLDLDMVFKVRTVVIGVCILSLQFLICIMGQQVYDKSLRIADGIYESNWYLINNKDVNFATRHIMNVIQARPKELSAYGFFSANLSTFLSILKFTYTIVALFMHVGTHQKNS